MLLYYISKTTLAKIVTLSDALLHRVLRTLDLFGNARVGPSMRVCAAILDVSSPYSQMKSCGTETRAKQQRFISICEVGPSMHTGRQVAPDSFTGGSESGNSTTSIRRLIGDQVIL
jgi:hypothetical protein